MITLLRKNKNMVINKSNTSVTVGRLTALLLSAMMFLVGGGLAMPSMANADTFDAQINALNQQNSQNRASVQQLGAQAANYQDAINKLQAQIDNLQAEINHAQAQVTQIQTEIAQKEIELKQQKKLLGEDIRQMYVEGQISTLEMLASSKNISDFVDKQVYRNSVQSKITTTLGKITELQHQLKAQEEALQQTIRDQQSAEEQVSAQQAQQDALLGATVAQQDQINSQIKANNAQIAGLRAAQAAANGRLGGTAVAGDPGHGGYPAGWDAPVGQDTIIDSWGMYNRECVSYTAWKVYQTYGRMPYWGGHGNANQWPASAQADGIETGSTPRPQSVAISMTGYYGHAMWVESVNGNGTINVSQYNQDLTGHYSEVYGRPSAGLIFIYFN